MDNVLLIAPQCGRLRLADGRERAPARRWALAATLAAAVMASVMLVPHLAKRSEEAPLVVLSARAATYERAGLAPKARVRTLKVGDRLPAGGVVRTGEGGRLTLVTRRGSEFTLNANSELALAARNTASLRRGEIYCRSRAGEIKLVNTAAGKIHLLGTVIDAAAQDPRHVAVTVVTGKVRLSNAHGEAVVPAGQRSLMVASAAPSAGAAANVASETAWYDGRGTMVSDFGDIIYALQRHEGLMTEIWTMRADGSNKHRIKSFLGFSEEQHRWLPGQQWVMAKSRSACWADPDFETRRGEAGYYTVERSIVQDAEWLVDAATGQEVAVEQLESYDLHSQEISPDGTRVAFTGAYQPDPENMDTREGGLWVYDLRTGQTKKVVNGYTGSVTWSPDSRWVVAATGSSEANQPLVLIDTDTAITTQLGVQGRAPSLSPDGTRLAYWEASSIQGSVWMLDLKSNGEPRRVAPEGEEPRWSPDGARIVYWVTNLEWVNPDTGERHRGPYPSNISPLEIYAGYRVFVTDADGSATTEVYHTEPVAGTPHVRAVCWAPAGDALYLLTDGGILLVVADGSGRARNLGGTDDDSILPPPQSSDTEAALKAVQEAVFQYAVGDLRSFQGRPDDARAAFQASADIFAALPWQFPLADFSSGDVLRYADKAQAMAERPAATVLAESCRRRLRRLASLLVDFVVHDGHFPAALSELETWGLKDAKNPVSVRMIFRCPEGGLFAYTPPPAGGEPQFGALMIACPQHGDSRFAWNDGAADNLGRHRYYEQRQQLDRDPQLKALYGKTTDMRWAANAGAIPWTEVEAAYAALINRLPDDMWLRVDLGRMYVRRGAYEEALRALPPPASALWPWTQLTRAFCLDALGRRAEALALYQRLQRSIAPLLSRYAVGPTTSAGAWARLGLRQPTWPRDLDTRPHSGEVRLTPTTGWRASCSPAKNPAKPELAIDGNLATPWFGYSSDGREGQRSGTWFQLDLGAPQPISRILLDHQGGGLFFNDWPRALEAWGTSDGKTWSKAPVTQAGPLQGAEIRFASPQLVRALRFVLSADHEPAAQEPEYWRISEVYVFGPPR